MGEEKAATGNEMASETKVETKVKTKAKSKIKQKTDSKKIIAAAIVAIIAITIIGVAITQMAPPAKGNGNGNGDGMIVPPAGEITTFTDTGKTIELQDGKPVIRLFSTTWCPHCKWIKTTFDKVAREYVAEGKIVAYHWELDTQDNALTAEAENGVPQSEQAIFQEFSTGGVPTFVFGGKYVRIGNGFEVQGDLIAEEAEFKAVIEALIAEAEKQ